MLLFCVQLVSWKGQLSLLPIILLQLAKTGTTFYELRLHIYRHHCPYSTNSPSRCCLSHDFFQCLCSFLKDTRNPEELRALFPHVPQSLLKRGQTGEVAMCQERLASLCPTVTRSSHWAALAYASWKEPLKHDPLALLHILNWDKRAAPPAHP